MKILPTEFEKKGFGYRQVRRQNMVAVYSQHHKGLDGPLVGYEVIVIKSHDGYEMGGTHIPAAEMYPSTKNWGSLGWTYSGQDSQKKAIDKMGQVCQDLDIKAQRTK